MLSVIHTGLSTDYLKFPTREEFLAISQGFAIRKNFPNCLGAMDGKHVRITKPYQQGSNFYNYKLYHSIVLLAVVDACYCFTIVDVGSYGKNSDGGVFNNSTFGQLLNSNQLDLPANEPLPNTFENDLMPFVFVADEAFKLSEHIMKPYPRRDLDRRKRIYNYRLSRARQQIECSFGILAAKFRIFRTEIAVFPEKVDKIINAGVVLHNYIRREEKCNSIEIEECGAFSSFSTTEEMFEPRSINQSSRLARGIRDKFADYFCNAGAVDFQEDNI